MRMTTYLGAALMALAATAGLTSSNVKAQQGTVPATPTPAGTWWGIARACTDQQPLRATAQYRGPGGLPRGVRRRPVSDVDRALRRSRDDAAALR